MINQFGAEFLRESLQPGSMTPQGNSGEHDAPYGVYRCAGEDQWCAVTIRGDADWERLCTVIGAPDLAASSELRTAAGRVARRADIDGRLEAWTAQHPPELVMRRMQDAGVPAGAMLRIGDLRGDAQLGARRFFTVLLQPQLGELPAMNGSAVYRHAAGPLLGPAPLQGEHTWEIARDLLGLPETQARQLIADDVLQPADATVPDPAGA
jgi:crotonobetainyl-CoA:carnitine CoA-transferase CaiB-like acyl-CoA transferase